MQNQKTAVLLISCRDKEGIVAAVTALLSRLGANIIYLDQHVDYEESMFFMRVEWTLSDFSVTLSDFDLIFTHEVARQYEMTWDLREQGGRREKMAIFVSKYAHCFFDLIGRWKMGALPVDISLVVSNHSDLKEEAERFGIPFVHIPVTAQNREEAALEQSRVLSEHNIDFIVLARYMQIVPPSLIAEYPNRIINIHHSFLPSFPGAKPYHQAYERGVKITGATAHYVTEELDAGPIIEQDVQRINHKFSVKDLISGGQDVEMSVLSKAVLYHLERKVFVYNNRTIIFA